MKVGFTAALVAAITAAAIAVVPAFSTGSRASKASASIPARVKALERKVKVLQARLNLDEACANTVAPATSYPGYVYSPDNGTTYGFTTALDFTVQGQTPQVYLQL